MPNELSIGVLSPFLGGWYYGGLLTGIVRAGADAGRSVVALQTLDAGTEQLEIDDPPDLAALVALQRVAGYVVIINAATPQYLSAIREAGRPLVVISHQFPELDCPVVLSDNHSGVREAVTHLIEHGHQRIAFAGFLGADDVRQRYDAYRETLQEHGITPDSRLLYEANENQQGGGESVARAMIAAGLPSTAMVAGTDANALGIMHVLNASGYHLPRDQAVIGFDDVRAGAYASPRLSSVKQSFESLGATAVAALLDEFRGDPGPRRRHVPTSLVVRESCGCSGRPAPSARAPRDLSELDTPERMVEAARIVHDESLHAMAAAVSQGDAPATGEIAERAQSTILALMQTQGQAQFTDLAHLEETLDKQYEVSMELLRSHEEDPRQLRWLARTSASAGCLGLWVSGRKPATDVEVAGTFARHGAPCPPPGRKMDVEVFPPAELAAEAVRRADGLVMVVPVKVGASDWGLLAIADTVDIRVGTGREPVNHWAALLTVALDRQLMLRELHQREEQLRTAALYDHLTGLPNRTLFLDRLRQAIQRANRNPDHRYSVLFVDLDGFKVVNDSMGHAAGDRLLVMVAKRFQDVVRASDTAARYGGDEFLVLLDGIEEPNTPSTVAQRLHAALASPFHLDGQELVVGASIGIAIGGDGDQDAEDLLRDADIAMYAAKSQRKGSHVIFDAEMHARAVSRLRIETEFRHALERQEFDVYYQPIVHLASARIAGFEALARWRHPVRGLLSPAEFLPVAEETGLIVSVGRWILGQVCDQLAGSPSAGRSTPWISLNVSQRQFWDEGFVEDVGECLRSHGLEPGRLALEITEDVILRDAKRARDILHELRGLGCRMLIDDLGVGYSSVEVFYDLPIDGLKIGQAFVSRLGADARSRDLVRTIVAMAGDLQIIAEGVETALQRDMLIELGCAYGQGHLLSRPMLPSTPTRLLATPAP